jgi:hypothetical protein
MEGIGESQLEGGEETVSTEEGEVNQQDGSQDSEGDSDLTVHGCLLSTALGNMKIEQ